MLYPILLFGGYYLINSQTEAATEKVVSIIADDIIRSLQKTGSRVSHELEFIAHSLVDYSKRSSGASQDLTLLGNYLYTDSTFETIFVSYLPGYKGEEESSLVLTKKSEGTEYLNDEYEIEELSDSNLNGKLPSWYYDSSIKPIVSMNTFPIESRVEKSLKRFATLITAPIYDSEGSSLIGVVGMLYRNQYLLSSLTEFLDTEDVGLMLSSNDGTIFFSYAPDVDDVEKISYAETGGIIGTNFSNFTMDNNQEFFDALNYRKTFMGKASSILYEGDALFHLVPFALLEGAPSGGIFLLLDYPLASFNYSTYQFIAILLVAGLFFLAIIAIALYVSLKRETDAIKDLTEIANVIAKGNYQVEVDLELAKRTDSSLEMDVLYSSLREMVNRFKYYVKEKETFNAKLERRIEERTYELFTKTEEAEREKRNAEEALRTETTFITNMSHEVRTPLNAILSMAKLLDVAEMDTVKKGYINIINRASDTLLDTVNNLLDISKLDTTQFEIENNDYKLIDLVQTISNVLNIRTAEKNITFNVNINPNIPSVYKGDRDRIHQVLLNLLTNAVKFTSEG